MHEFKAGDRVRLVADYPLSRPDRNGIYVVGAAVPLPNADEYVVDPQYWDWKQYEGYRKKTNLDLAGHPQVVFLEGVLKLTDLPQNPRDPDNKGRSGFSGKWLEPAN